MARDPHHYSVSNSMARDPHHYSVIFRLGSSDNRIEWTDATSPSIIFRLGSSDNRMLTGSFKKDGHSHCHVIAGSANYWSQKCLSASLS